MTTLARLRGWLAHLAVALLIVIAIMVAVGRELAPLATRLRAPAEQWLSKAFGLPATLEHIQLGWRGLVPVLRAHGLRVRSLDGKDAIELRELRVQPDLIASLTAGAPRAARISVVGARFGIVHDARGWSVKGMGPLGADSAVLDALLAQLGSAGELSLLDSTLGLRALDRPEQRFTGVNLHISRGGHGLRLSGALQLPARLGQSVRIVAEMNGEIGAPRHWRGRWYLHGERLIARAWLPETAQAHLHSGSATLELWGELLDGHLREVQGDVAIERLRLAGKTLDGHDPSSFGLAATLRWRRDGGGWRLDAAPFRIFTGDTDWPRNGLSVDMERNAQGEQRLRLALDHLQLQALRGVLPAHWLPVGWREPLAGAAPEGVIEALRASLTLHDAAVQAYALTARASDLGLRRHGALPGARGLDGEIRFDARQGRLILNTQDGMLDLQPLFRAPLSVQKLAGELRWQRDGDITRIESDELIAENADIQTRTRLAIEVPHAGSPWLDLRSSFHDAVNVNAKRYFPVTLLSKKVVGWLDHAFSVGSVPQGAFLWHGRVDDFPFDAGRGRFQVNFDVADATLDYAPGWPPLTGLAASIAFDGRGLAIETRQGRIYDSALGAGRADIADLEDATLHVVANARSRNADLLKLLRETALVGTHVTRLADLEFTGDSLFDLDLTLPIAASHQPAQFTGRLTLTNASLHGADATLALDRINGPLSFSTHGLASNGLKARLFGAPANIRIRSDASAMRFDLDGRVDAATLRKLLPAPWNAASAGATDFQLGYSIATASDAASTLTLASTLQGLDLSLPEPFTKAAEDSAPIRLDARMQEIQTDIQVQHGDTLSATLVLDADRRVARGALQLGAGPATLPEQGLTVSGRLDRYDSDEWARWLEGQDTLANHIALNIGELKVGSQRLRDLRLDATRNARAWDAALTGMELAGKVNIPHDAATPIRVQLERFDILAEEEEEETPAPDDPRRLRPLDIEVTQLGYHGQALGKLRLVTDRTSSGLMIREARITGPVFDAEADGEWHYERGEHRSQLKLKLKTPLTGRLMETFGYSGQMGRAPMRAEAQFAWPDALTRFALAQLTGKLHLDIGAGTIDDIQPGAAGRVFGLLNLATLQRRLRLDFSDLFNKGMSFDTIRGDFILASGNASTDNLVLDSPAAHIAITGRTGLVNQDYDQILTLTPRLSATLPIAGAIVVNPAVGAALLAGQKLLQGSLDTLARTQYRVTGSWQKPNVERLKTSHTPKPSPATETAP
jgi:uncharacterized protein (TIGR02099 family)